MRAALTSAAPGRINIIGEHTDYTMGLAMPAAIDRWILVSITAREDDICDVISRDFQSGIKIRLDGEFTPAETWQQYVYGAISVFHETSHFPHGFNTVISGNIPIGSGLSSSGALEVALMNAFRSLYGLKLDDREIIKLCQRVEHEHLHIQSGLLDQFASQFSKGGQLMVIDFAELACDYFEADMGNYTWVVADSRVTRELADSKYMERVRQCKKGLEVIRDAAPAVEGFRDITEKHLAYLNETIRRRIRHYVRENARVLAAKQSILEQDFIQLGRLLTESHLSLKTDYEVSCAELDFLVETAMNHSGCFGSRMMGGGFGGCTLSLVDAPRADDFMGVVQQAYRGRFSEDARIYRFNLVDGADIFSLSNRRKGT